MITTLVFLEFGVNHLSNSQLHQNLIDDLDRICVSLIKSYGLKFTQKEESLSSPLMRWIDFVSRYIPCSQRQVAVSAELTHKLKNSLPKQAVIEFDEFASRSISGSDLNPFQSKGLVLYNDTSNNNKPKRTDLLFADWGVLHFHLSSEIKPEEYFATRSDWLLFSIVFDDIIFCIDVLPHAEKEIFSRTEMLEIIYKNWSFLLEPYEMKRIHPGINWSNSEVAELRKAGVSSCYSICDKVFIPRGLGLTTAAVPVKNIHMIQNVMHGVRCIANIIEDPKSDFKMIGDKSPKYELSLTQKGLALYDVNNDVAYTLPRDSSGKDALALLQDLVTPSWVCLKEN